MDDYCLHSKTFSHHPIAMSWKTNRRTELLFLLSIKSTGLHILIGYLTAAQ